MKSKIINCKTCNAEIASNAKVCPHCGAKNRKPIYKRFWLWFLVVVAIGSVAIAGSDTEPPIENNPSSSFIESSQSEVTTTKQEESSVVEMYQLISESDPTSFTIPDKAIEFMTKHEAYFPGKSEIKGQISDSVNTEITFEHLDKNVEKYADKLIEISGSVVDIEEINDGDITYIHVADYLGNNYTMYYLGSLDDIFTGSEVYGYALPLDMVTFENKGGAFTESVMCAACYIEDNGL